MQRGLLWVSQQLPRWPQEAARGLFGMGGPLRASVSSSARCGEEQRRHTGLLSLGSVGRAWAWPLLGWSQASVLTPEPQFPRL